MLIKNVIKTTTYTGGGGYLALFWMEVWRRRNFAFRKRPMPIATIDFSSKKGLLSFHEERKVLIVEI